MEQKKQIFTITKAAEYIGKTRAGVYHLIKEGKLAKANEVVGMNGVYKDSLDQYRMGK
jgi:predicted DNA-binding transcriptional regulator AlpA